MAPGVAVVRTGSRKRLAGARKLDSPSRAGD